MGTGGGLDELTRAFDWASTPLGPAADWPRSLHTIVRVVLDSRYAMWLGWGPGLTFLYNDAYARMTLGPKHPGALGRPARDVWPEIWGDIAPRVEAVVRDGQATWDEGLLLFLERRGFTEETYHTFSYSPVPDDAGGVGGLLCVVTEDTARTIGERRLRTLRELAARTTEEATSAEDACRTAALALAHNPRDLPFALAYLLDDGGTAARLAGAAGLPGGSPAAPGRVELGDPGAAWPFAAVLASGRAAAVDDLEGRFGPLPGAAWPEPTRRAVVVPVAKPGQARPAGFLVAGLSPRLAFDDDYRGFLDLLAGHVGTAVASARAYAEERRRAEALAELDRAKTSFFSNVSHEFRTPLALVLGPVEDLLSRSHADLPPAAADQLEIALRNGRRLLRLVNTLLDFSRIEAGRVRAAYRPTDLAAYTADLASVFRSACERAGLRLTVDCQSPGEPAYVDREMWEKVVLNLLSNAFKFTLAGGITVTLRRAGWAAELRVSDTGTGVPAAEVPRLFERFHRVENARGRTHEGSGIGLALVHELVKLHGGTITAESRPGEGTTFTVTVPLGKAHLPPDQVAEGDAHAAAGTAASPFVEEALRWLPEEDRGEGSGDRGEEGGPLAADPPPPTPHPSGTEDARPRVLVADDNADMRQYVARLLAGAFRVETAADGEAARAAARARPPELVLSDVMMPRLDGFGLLRELRADPRTRGVPVILLSARAGEESRVEGMDAGADDYLVKPFGARELLARVSAHVQMARLRREAGAALRASEERLRLVIESARDFAIITLDPAGVVTGWNSGARNLLGYDAAEIVGRDGRVIFTPEDCAKGQPEYEMTRAREAGRAENERWHVRKDGSRFWGSGLVMPLAAGGDDAGFLKIMRDMTEARRAKELLERQAEALRAADRMKDEFLATLAHELRNPLAPIRNGLQIMKLAGGDRAAVDHARNIMERQLGQMVRLVDDLLDLSRVSRGKVELRRERVELAAVVQNAVETSRPAIDQAGHRLAVEVPTGPVFVDADPTRLAQVFANLLNNAAKYTEPGGRVTLTATAAGGEAVVSVRDTGVGIPAEMLPRVFDMFTQVDRSLERSAGGLGIGLTLVKRLVEMHGGTVEARSDGPGKGSEFVVRLPLLTGEGRGGRGEPDGLSDPSPLAPRPCRRVLVVDDNRDAAVSLATLLRLLGNETRTAFDGLAALSAGAEFEPDVVLMDLGMPLLNGFDACRRLRREAWGRDAVVVALTGWGQDEDRRRSRAAGFDHHLTKPVDPDALAAILAGLPLAGGRPSPDNEEHPSRH